MGWLFYGHVPRDIPNEIARICTSDQASHSMAPVAMARCGSTWYVAVRIAFTSAEAADTCSAARQFSLGGDLSYTFGAVFLTEVTGDGWGYKDIDETMGPVHSNAPPQILERLSPTTSPFAMGWRARCRVAAPVRVDELWVCSERGI